MCCPRLFFPHLNGWRYREDMLKRAKVLQKKQRSGQGAPPTPTLRFSSVSPTPTVPNFTPVHPARWQGVNSMQPRLVAPSFLVQNYTATSAITPCSPLLTLVGPPRMLHYHQEGGCRTGGQYRHAGVYAKTSCECVARP